jgi:hypothetical protein
MIRRLPSIAALTLVALGGTTSLEAQTGRFEVVPQFGYTWGGSRDFDAGTVEGIGYPAGQVKIGDSFSYGLTLSFEGARNSFFTLSYVRQDTDLQLEFNRALPPDFPIENPENLSAGFATNQFIVGFRQEFAQSRTQKLRFYLGGGLGFNVMDVKEPGVGSNTYFLLTPHGGVRYMFGPPDERSRIGLQADIRGIFTFVPSGDVGIYCDYWGFCYAYEGTATVSQGTVSAGVVIKF